MKEKIVNIYLLIFVVILAAPLLIDAFNRTGTRHYLAFLFSVIIALSIRIIFNIKPFYFVLFSFPVLLLSINYDVLVLEYKTFINITTWFAIFNTDYNEATDFVANTALSTKLLVVFQILAYLFFLFLTYRRSISESSGKVKKILLVLLLFFSVDFFLKGATRVAFPFRGLEGLYDYVSTKITEAKYLDIKRNAKFDAVRKPEFANDQKETIVIVVGESLRRDHLGYYGYARETTPLIKNEDLIIFSDVVSPANQTINSLKRVFTRAEMLTDNYYWKEPSLIKAFKEVGFTTYWITTQPVYGRHESEASFIGEETDMFIDEHKRKNGYDENLLSSYKKVLHNGVNKKIIFLHIMGNHASYRKRYPPDFSFFDLNDNSDKKQHIIDLYDNAVKYNDYFLHKVLTGLKHIRGEKSFIMFSDHGESLFDTEGFCYHGSANPSKSEYIVPLILWLSGEFKANHPSLVDEISANKDKPVLLSDMFHALPGLYGIEFEKRNKKNDFFSHYYKSKLNRKVLNVDLELLDYNNLP